MATNTATPSTMPTTVSSERTACFFRYGQLMSRSSRMHPYRLTSPTIFPSRIVMVRWQVCGHVRVVRDDENRRAELTCRSLTSRRMSAPVCVSRLPVGSSASRIGGYTDSARAMATRWRSPPDSSSGKMVHALGQLHQVEQLARTIVDLLPWPAAQMQRKRHILDARQTRQQIEELKDEAELVAPHRRQAHRLRGRRDVGRRA